MATISVDMKVLYIARCFRLRFQVVVMNSYFQLTLWREMQSQ